MKPAILIALALALVLGAGGLVHGLAALREAPHQQVIARLDRGEAVPLAELDRAAADYRQAMITRRNAAGLARLGRVSCAKAAVLARQQGRPAMAIAAARAYSERCLNRLAEAMRRDPALPYAAFVYALVGATHGAPPASVDAALRRSIAAGPALLPILAPRLELGLTRWPSLGPEARRAVRGQLRLARDWRPTIIEGLARTPLRRALIATLLAAPEPG